MALKRYGVLIGKAVEVRLGVGQTPHYEVRVVDDTTDYRIAINVKSQLAPSELEYVLIENFSHPLTAIVEKMDLGFTELPSKPDSGALDFIRGNLFDRSLMRILPHTLPGLDNDLNEKIDSLMQRAMGDENSLVYAFGERWGPEQNKKDKYFGFLPGNGIHDIHMNQSNAGQFVQDDGVWQDGGLLVHFPDQNEWVAVFLKFQSQGWHTDDVTGHKIGVDTPPGTVPPGSSPVPGGPPETVPPTTEDPQGLVRIVAALVNSSSSPEEEFVTILNTSPHTISLDGWGILDGQERRHSLQGQIQAGQALSVRIQPPVALSNKGGLITIVDENGLKVDGVSYTREQAKHPGWTIVF